MLILHDEHYTNKMNREISIFVDRKTLEISIKRTKLDIILIGMKKEIIFQIVFVHCYIQWC